MRITTFIQHNDSIMISLSLKVFEIASNDFPIDLELKTEKFKLNPFSHRKCFTKFSRIF